MTAPIQLGADWAGLTLSHPRVMGILNVTPDSFSDGGTSPAVKDAVNAGLRMAAEGADIVDVGGESTRPGAQPVPPEIEQVRVVPVIRALGAAGVRVSVDTRNSTTMAAALDAGAAIVNDVSALSHDPRSLALLAQRDCPVVLMHMRGKPDTMNALANYRDVAHEVAAELGALIAAAEQAGISAGHIAIDPGIGFAKRAAHSVELLRRLPELASLGYPIVIGVSRKAFIGRLGEEPEPRARMPGSLAAALFAVSRGANVLRVHDVRATVQALKIWSALNS
ncbi:MAG: dihydropteroate synthase [Acetobacteraceae bacterium]|nr:dihydropteroate synthase [Acetobacteraceae bacterium]